MTEVEIARIAELQNELIAKGGPTKGKPLKDADPVKLEELKGLLDKQRAEAKVTPIAPIPLAAPPEEVKPMSADVIATERELRRYVKRDGGFRKNLSKEAQAEAERLMKILGRTSPAWDLDITVPGIA